MVQCEPLTCDLSEGLGGKYPIMFPAGNREREERERKKRTLSFSLRSTEFRRSDFVEPKTKVHLIDEGYANVPEMRDFFEDPKEEIFGNQRFRAREASYPCSYAPRGKDSSYLGLFSTFGLRKRDFSF